MIAKLPVVLPIILDRKLEAGEDLVGAADKVGRLTSVLSTTHGKHGNEASHTEAPRKSLVTELDAQSALYSTERLADDTLYPEIEIALRSLGDIAPYASTR